MGHELRFGDGAIWVVTPTLIAGLVTLAGVVQAQSPSGSIKADERISFDFSSQPLVDRGEERQKLSR
jgi:hypothetical protein